MKIKHEDFKNKKTFSQEELIALACGHLIEDLPKEGIPACPTWTTTFNDRSCCCGQTQRQPWENYCRN